VSVSNSLLTLSRKAYGTPRSLWNIGLAL
jgi:hypothetical protein